MSIKDTWKAENNFHPPPPQMAMKRLQNIFRHFAYGVSNPSKTKDFFSLHNESNQE